MANCMNLYQITWACIHGKKCKNYIFKLNYSLKIILTNPYKTKLDFTFISNNDSSSINNKLFIIFTF